MPETNHPKDLAKDQHILQASSKAPRTLSTEKVSPKARGECLKLGVSLSTDEPGAKIDLKVIKKTLDEGSVEAFMFVCANQWAEVIRPDSELREPFRRFVSKHPRARLSAPSPILPAVFLLSGEEVLKEWAMLNICELPPRHSPIGPASKFYYTTHSQIRLGESPYRESCFLTAFFLYVYLGGGILPGHEKLLVALIKNKANNGLHQKFNVFKILLGTMVEPSGQAREWVAEIPAATQLVEESIEALFASGLEALLAQARQDPHPKYRILPFFTTWEVLKAGMGLCRAQGVKLSILIAGKNTNHPAVLPDVRAGIENLYCRQEIDLITLIRKSLLGFSIGSGNEEFVSLLATDTLNLLGKAAYARESSESDHKVVVIRMLNAWREKIAQAPLLVVARFLPLVFFRGTGREEAEAHNRDASHLHIRRDLQDKISAVVRAKAPLLLQASITPREIVMAASLVPKTSCAVGVAALIEVSHQLKEYLHRFNVFPQILENFCSVIERFITDATTEEMLCLHKALVHIPVVDAVLSQINYITVRVIKSTEKSVSLDFEWLHQIDLTRSQKKALKTTFLNHTLELYLELHAKTAIDPKILERIKQHVEQNQLGSDLALKRQLTRAERLLEKQREPASHDAPARPEALPIAPLYENQIFQPIETTLKRPEEVYTPEPLIMGLVSADLPAQSPRQAKDLPWAYASFAEYYQVFSPLIIDEARANICLSPDKENEKMTGKVTKSSTLNDSAIITITIKDTSPFSKNSIVLVHDLQSNELLGRGLVTEIKKPKKVLTVRMKSYTRQRSTKITIQVLSSAATHIREYAALLALHQGAYRAKILDPRTPAYIQPPALADAPPKDVEHVSTFHNLLNNSQKKAVNFALTHDITLIKGPPGTGKTKTITAIIGFGLLMKWRVLVCAPSNAAVDMLWENASNWGNVLTGITATRASHSTPYTPTNLVFSTLSYAGSSSLAKSTFDLVIVDEACQATEPSTLIPLRTKPSRFVLVGDPMQLPPTVLSQNAHLSTSLFARLATTIAPELLDTQYRMHPNISAFPSKQFYQNALKNAASYQDVHLPLAFINIEGTERTCRSSTTWNEEEANAVLQLVPCLAAIHSSLGIITPYLGQVEAINMGLSLTKWSNLPALTVDSFQGQEKDCIVFSAVRTLRIGFLSDTRRMNVALTRAKKMLIVLGNASLLAKNPAWNSFIRHCQETNQCFTLPELTSLLKKHPH
ncbi:regulator of nonsense transcripts 1 [Nematocida displodere]|uniref:Regulator of nonsense transcripts 1 n=1 Tax=Nematocida displodere TaxID=1805483 RepID=A0A177EBR1_9MICR|nr:regulator of nonsense transcripts 1 [Nematocida displodere]